MVTKHLSTTIARKHPGGNHPAKEGIQRISSKLRILV